MSQELVISITAKDGTSQVFRTVGASAKQMATSLKSGADGAGASMTKLGAEATKAGTQVQQAGTKAASAAKDFDKLGDSATKIGASIGTGVAVLSRLGGQAENQRRSISGLEKAYGSAADQIIDFTEAIQDSTKFSNEQARDAAQIASTLVKNYGMSADAVEELISVSADLATVYGMDLADAVQRTSSALRGEAESAEALGLSLSDSYVAAQAAARGMEGWNTTMSESEKAAFRMELLLEQVAYAHGAAGEAAATSAGQAAQLGNAFQDIGTNIGAALGPLAGMAAGLNDYALIIPLIGAGVGKAVAEIGKLTQAAKANQAVMSALSSPAAAVTLGLTALAAGALIVINAWQDQQAENAALAESYGTLSTAIMETQSAQQQLAANEVRFDFGIEEQLKALADLGIHTGQIGQQAMDKLTLSTEELTHANDLLTASYRSVSGEGMDELISAMNRLETDTESFKTSGDDAIAMLEDLNAALAYNGDGAEIIDEAVRNLNVAFAEGRITQAQYAEGLDYLANNSAEYVAELQGATEAVETFTKAQLAAKRAAVEQGLEGQSARWNALADSINEANEAALAPSLASGAGFGLGLGDEERAEIEAYGEALAEAKARAAEVAAELRGQLVPALDGASHGFDGMVQPGEDVLDTLQRIAPNVDNAGGALLRMADGLQDAAQGMDAVLGTFAAIDDLGGRSEKAGSIAEELVGAPGEWATIDDLLSTAAISQGEYNAALEAGYAIQTRSANVEADLNEIRAQQLPLLAEQEAAYGAYINRLADASTLEQQQALYLMDSANQAKVAAAYSTAYAASLGEIPEDVATTIIADGAQADPVLGDILEGFGLIERGANGEVTVNFPNASTLDDVVESIDRLTEISAVELLIEMSGGEIAAEDAERVRGVIDELDGKTAETSVTVSDEGVDTVEDVKNDIEALDGATAVTSVVVESDGADTVQSVKEDVEELDGSTATISVEFSTQSAKSPLTGVDTPESTTVTVDIVANDEASATIARVMQAASAVQTVAGDVQLNATDNASATIARVMQTANALSTVAGDVDLNATDNASATIARVMQAANALSTVAGDVTIDATDNASSVIARAMQAANAFDAQTYTADLKANDSSGGAIAQAMQAANAFASGQYQATLTAQDASGTAIAQAMQAANAFAVTYTATLSAADNASSTIGSAQGAAAQFASTYQATLSAADSASGTISQVMAAVTALDGMTATVYVNAVDNTGGALQKKLGGMIDYPRAALGRVVTVGEAGEENVVLPYGAMVQPSPARNSRETSAAADIGAAQAKKSLVPDVDMGEAYKKGGDSAKAFYDGLLDEARSRVKSIRSELGSTVYGSREEGEAAIAEYQRALDEMDKLKRLKGQAGGFDQDKRRAQKDAEDAAAAVESTMSEAGDDIAASGAAAGEEFSAGLAEGIDVSSAIAQVMALKDEFMATMRGTGGSIDSATSAVDSFNQEVQSIVGGLKGAAKTSDNQTEKIADDFGGLEESADDAGGKVGESLADGVQSGAKDASKSLGDVASEMESVASKEINPEVEADNKKANDALKATDSQLNNLDGESATVDVRVDDADWQRFKDDVDGAQLGVVVTIKTKDDSKGKAGKKLGGTILADEVPHAALGRVVTVGEAGQESVVLPYGSMVIPHPASASRNANEPAYGANFYAPVTIMVPTADIAAAIAAQGLGIDR